MSQMNELISTENVKKAALLFLQWKLGATQPQTSVTPKAEFKGLPDRNYNLKNAEYRKYLQYEDQTFGINIGWTDNATNDTGNRVARWFFARNGQSQAPITYGEPVALGYGNSPSFVHYEDRSFGINLVWSKKPVFEWQILGGKKGDPVLTKQWIAIYNMEVNECLIAFDRTVGGDIGWPSSQTWSDVIGDAATLVWKETKDAAIKLLLTESGLILVALV